MKKDHFFIGLVGVGLFSGLVSAQTTQANMVDWTPWGAPHMAGHAPQPALDDTSKPTEETLKMDAKDATMAAPAPSIKEGPTSPSWRWEWPML